MLRDFTPRLYQQTILGTAAAKNTLVVLPTGLGKTGIALLLAAQRLQLYPTQKILLLSPTKPLCEQHLSTFQRHLDLPPEKIVLFTGSVAPEKRGELWKEAQVVISTPQGLENDTINRRVKLEEVSLLVLDEAHHSTGDYSYVWLAQQYEKISRFPRILALTASPGSDLEKIKEICQNLKIEKIEVRTDKDPDVQPYIQPLQFQWVKVEFPEEFKKIRQQLEECRKSKLSEAQKHGYTKGLQVTKTELLALQGELQQKLAAGIRDFEVLRLISLVAEVIKVEHALELLESQGLAQLHGYFQKIWEAGKSSKVKAIKNLLNDPYFKSAMFLTDQLVQQNVQHPKLPKLQELLQEELKLNSSAKIIVFTQFRNSADQIVKLLAEKGISNSIFVGQAKKEGIGFSQKQQKEILDRFRAGEFSTLVATSVHPEEYIVLQNPKEEIELLKIGDFVEKFENSFQGWKALSVDENGPCLSPITGVFKHKRKSQVVKIRLSSGFECCITENHSLFTFNNKRELVSSPPQENLFVHLLLSGPALQKTISEVDLIKELSEKVPGPEKKNIFCLVKHLHQAKIRELTSELKVLKVLSTKPLSKGDISVSSRLNRSTITEVTARLRRTGRLSENLNKRKKICAITPSGEEYLRCLAWLSRHMHYHKRKYRITLQNAARAPSSLRNFFELEVGVWYGKKTVKSHLSLQEDLGRFLGLYVAEGATRHTKKTSDVYLAGRKKEMQELMMRSINLGLGITPNRSWRGVYASAQIIHYLVKYVFGCGVGAYHKEVPNKIFTASNEVKWAFLEGYFLGDGYYDAERGRIILTTMSRKLVVGLIFLLRQLGIRRVTLRKDHAYRVCIYESLPFACLKEKNYHKGKNYYSTMPLALVDKNYFSFYGNYHAVKKLTRRSGRISKEVETKTCFDYIKTITVLEKQPEYVYDIAVAKTQKFVGGPGMITLHNSVAEEGLDIPKVDKVIFYEPVPSAIRSIQRRGRTGRLEKGEVTILITQGTRDEGYRWSSFHKERQMYRHLEGLKRNLALLQMDGAAEKPSPTLHKFIPEHQLVAVLADHREKDNKIVKELIEMGLSVRTGQLDSADYLVSGRVAVELKKVPDFVASIIDGRLLEQVRELKRKFDKAVLVIEGEEDIYAVRKVHANAIRGMLSSIVLDFGVPVLYTKNPKDTAGLLAVMARREQEKERDFSYHERKPQTIKEQQEFLVSSLPGVGVQTARKLLEIFGSVKNVMKATKEELIALEGVGEKTAERLVKLVEEKYRKEES